MTDVEAIILMYMEAGRTLTRSLVGEHYSLIETAKLNGVDPEAYLRDVLAISPTTPPNASPTCCLGPGP